MKDFTISILILAGGSINSKSPAADESTWDHPLMLPAGNELALHKIIDFYRDIANVSNIQVIIDKPLPCDVPLNLSGLVNIRQIQPMTKVVDTIDVSLKMADSKWVLINPITTLPTLKPELKSQILIGDQLLYQEDWSSLYPDDDGNWNFSSKESDYKLERASYPFTGIIISKKQWVQDIVNSLDPNKKADMLNIAEQLYGKYKSVVKHTPWLDLGHRSTYADCKMHRLASRSYNQIKYYSSKNLLVKSSSDTTRLKAEKQYLNDLPRELKRHFPYVLSQEDDHNDEHSIFMESIPFSNLAELYLYHEIGLNRWHKIISRIYSVQAEFLELSTPISGNSSWLYSQKLNTRWDIFIDNSTLSDSIPWWERCLNINGANYMPLSYYVVELSKALKPLESGSLLHLIHGDLCFNNILCDKLHCTIKLIDPRGHETLSHGISNGYGDSRYDLAKLNHSIDGKYDSIVNNLFCLSWHDSNHIDFDIYVPSVKEFLSSMLHELSNHMNISDHEMTLLTTSLFFSMLPLHADNPIRQQALAFNGMMLIEGILSTY